MERPESGLPSSLGGVEPQSDVRGTTRLPEELCSTIRKRVPDLTMPEKRGIVRALVKRVTVHANLNVAPKKQLRTGVEYRFPKPEAASPVVVLTDWAIGAGPDYTSARRVVYR